MFTFNSLENFHSNPLMFHFKYKNYNNLLTIKIYFKKLFKLNPITTKKNK
jgi:hypothetical protein